MLKLFRFDGISGQWIHVDYGVKGLEDLYARKGYVVEHPPQTMEPRGGAHVEHAR